MIAIEDINNDQKPDLLIGNFSGGLSFFSSDSVIIINSNPTDINNFNIYPNPTQRFITIENNYFGELRIKNTLGQTVLKINKETEQITLDLRDFKSGFYLIENNSHSSKIIVQ